MPNIEKRGTNSYRLRVDAGYDAAGKQIQHRKTIRIDDENLLKSKRKLDAYLAAELVKFQQEVESGQHVRHERTTFAEFVPIWKENYASQRLGGYTLRNYMYLIEAHLLPAFGHMELRKIKTMHIVAFFTRLQSPDGRKDGKDKLLAHSSIATIHKVLKSLLDSAEKWNLIITNPMNGVDRPIAKKAEKRTLRETKRSYTSEETRELILALFALPSIWKLYFIGLVLGGFRRGELLAAEWSDLDFARGGIHVRKQISMDENGRKREAELKTTASEGFVPMPSWYMTELTTYRAQWDHTRAQMGDQWVGDTKEYVFCAEDGRPYYPSTPSLTWRRFLAKHPNLPHIRLHDLRHTAAMLLREQGVDMKTIQERLRHSKLGTTADLYTHFSVDVNRTAADRLEQFDPRKS